MMQLSQITPVVLTYNEEPNLARVLDRLRWAGEVVVLDSFSTDATEAIARSYSNVTFAQRKFDDHASQWNHGITLVGQPWILALDADYMLGEGFAEEMASLHLDDGADAYVAAFRYLIFGHALRASLYPPRVVLFRRENCHFEKDGHTQILHPKGSTGSLRTLIDHDDRKPFTRWVGSQDKYAKLEAEKLCSASVGRLALQDRIRRTMILGPVVVFFYTLLARRAVLDGWAGWYYTFQRTLAEIMLSLRLLERKLSPSVPPVNTSYPSQPNP